MRFRLLAVFVVLACSGALWVQPAAASVELKLNYWSATSNVSGVYLDPQLPSNWTTQFWGGDFRWTSDASHWGIHLKYDTGSEGSWGGALGREAAEGFLRSGTDTVWSGDVFYAWTLSSATVRGFVGYGNMQQTWNFNIRGTSLWEAWQANGYRVGADATIPIRNSNFAFNASAAWYPSLNSTFSEGIPNVFSFSRSISGGTASDLSASIQYTWPQGWLVEGGYRWVTENIPQASVGGVPAFPGPATFTMNGPFFAVGYHW